MSIDGVFGDRGAQADRGRYIEDQWRDPRFGFAQGHGPGEPPSGKGPAAASRPLMGDDSLSLTPEAPDNPFESLIRHRQRRRRRRQQDDPDVLS